MSSVTAVRHEPKAYGDGTAFAEEWLEVRAKYPLVAARYLEVIGAITDAWRDREQSLYGALTAAKLCDPDSPIQATKEWCDSMFGIKFNNGPDQCSPPRDPEDANDMDRYGDDLENYLNCLEERIP